MSIVHCSNPYRVWSPNFTSPVANFFDVSELAASCAKSFNKLNNVSLKLFKSEPEMFFPSTKFSPALRNLLGGDGDTVLTHGGVEVAAAQEKPVDGVGGSEAHDGHVIPVFLGRVCGEGIEKDIEIVMKLAIRSISAIICARMSKIEKMVVIVMRLGGVGEDCCEAHEHVSLIWDLI
ncbi:putative cysteine-rich receptor-like protein kinase 9 [Senna tora]|uniref:Putative cysteine-rich receptor-like protein kinase 9 n=1 Tax=Senna tora TaxID=362788 RepID=A0A834SVM9_9FABA|nr:putative cysteine-rich receptor-like protein kinase 9 [Senna tora]